nr:hypothetical protein [Tanacetum cinerariifolium]
PRCRAARTAPPGGRRWPHRWLSRPRGRRGWPAAPALLGAPAAAGPQGRDLLYRVVGKSRAGPESASA